MKVPSLPDPSSKGESYSFCDAKVSETEPGQRLSTVLGHESGWNGLPEWSVSQALRQYGIFESTEIFDDWKVLLPSAVAFALSCFLFITTPKISNEKHRHVSHVFEAPLNCCYAEELKVWTWPLGSWLLEV